MVTVFVVIVWALLICGGITLLGMLLDWAMYGDGDRLLCAFRPLAWAWHRLCDVLEAIEIHDEH